MQKSAKPLLVMVACTTAWLAASPGAEGQQVCRIERSKVDDRPLTVTPRLAKELRAELTPGVSLVLEISAGKGVAAVARGSLELEVIASALPLRPRGVVTTKVKGWNLSSTLNATVSLTAPRLSPEQGGVLFDTSLASVDVSGLALDCDDVVVGLPEEGDEHDSILSHVGAVYPRRPVIFLSTTDSHEPASSAAGIRLVADDPAEMPFVVVERQERDGKTLVRLHSKLGVVMTGWVPSGELTTRPLTNVLFSSWRGSGTGRMAATTTSTPRPPSYRGAAKLVGGAPVSAGRGTQGFAKVAGDQSMKVRWECGRKQVQIFPEDLHLSAPMWVDSGAVTLPDGVDPCAARGGTP